MRDKLLSFDRQGIDIVSRIENVQDVDQALEGRDEQGEWRGKRKFRSRGVTYVTKNERDVGTG